MKTVKALSIVACLTSLLFIGQAQAEEVCRLLESDSDGDGWGWEGGASCRVTSDTGRTPQMNHPRTGQSLNIERIFWLWEDFNNRTISECQGYIVDPNQARDICSTCQVPAASVFHGSDGRGVFTLATGGTNRSVAGDVFKENTVDTNVFALKSNDDSSVGADQFNSNTNVVATQADTESTEAETDVNTECTVEQVSESSINGATEETIDCAVEEDVAADNTAESTTGENTATTQNPSNSSSAAETTTEVGTTGNTAVNTGSNVSEQIASNDSSVADQNTVASNAGQASLRATFNWNVDNNGIYSGALAIDFHGERTETGVRFWEESAAGQVGFYTLCEVAPSSMGPALTTQPGSVMTSNEDATACIDTDGDGFGWDGSASCIP